MKTSIRNGKVKSGKVPDISKLDIQILKSLKDNPEGLRAKSLIRITKTRERTLYNHLTKLKNKKLIQNIFPIWQLCHFQAAPLKLAKLLINDNIQSHKFSFVLQIIKPPYWWKRRGNKLLRLREFQFKPINWGNNQYHTVSKNHFLIQTFSTSIVFINQNEYHGKDSYECFIQALEDTLEMLRFLEERFNHKFFIEGIPNFYVRTHHYVKLRDELAKRCKKDRKRFQVIINKDLRAWVDLSEPFGIEFGHKDFAPEDARIWQNVVKDRLINNTRLPSEVDARQDKTDKQISKVVYIMEGALGNQQIFDHNMKSHLKVIDKLGTEMNTFSSKINLLFEYLKKLNRR